MKINNILDTINKALKDNGCTQGFFVHHRTKVKKLGNYYEYESKIYYCTKANKYSEFVSISTTEQLKDGQEEEINNNLDDLILSLFMTKMFNKDIYNSLIDNSYGDK